MDKTQKICQEMMITVNVNKIMEYYVVLLAKVLRFYNLSINPISCHAGLIIQSIFEQHSKFAIGFFLKKRSVQNSCQPGVQNCQQLGVTLNMGCEHRSSERYVYMNVESWTVLDSQGCREEKCWNKPLVPALWIRGVERKNISWMALRATTKC